MFVYTGKRAWSPKLNVASKIWFATPVRSRAHNAVEGGRPRDWWAVGRCAGAQLVTAGRSRHWRQLGSQVVQELLVLVGCWCSVERCWGVKVAPVLSETLPEPIDLGIRRRDWHRRGRPWGSGGDFPNFKRKHSIISPIHFCCEQSYLLSPTCRVTMSCHSWLETGRKSPSFWVPQLWRGVGAVAAAPDVQLLVPAAQLAFAAVPRETGSAKFWTPTMTRGIGVVVCLSRYDYRFFCN